jgi:hypothetical protein
VFSSLFPSYTHIPSGKIMVELAHFLWKRFQALSVRVYVDLLEGKWKINHIRMYKHKTNLEGI